MTTSPVQSLLNADRRRPAASSSALIPSSTAVAGNIATKRTLASLSFAIERLAHDVASEAIVIASFQRGAYFAPRAGAYATLAELGLAAVVMYAGDGVAVDGVVHVHSQPTIHGWASGASLCSARPSAPM